MKRFQEPDRSGDRAPSTNQSRSIMRNTPFLPALILLSLFAVVSQAQQKPELFGFYDSVAHPVLEPDKVINIQDVVLFKGGQEISLATGHLRLFKPIHGKTYGGIFTGKGSFILTPPSESERLEFQRQTKMELEEGRKTFTFTRAVLWFEESLLRDLGSPLAFDPLDVSREEMDAVTRSGNYMEEKTAENMIYKVMRELIEDHPQPFLFAHFFLPEKKDLFLEVDPRRFEEVVISRPPFEAITGSVFWRVMLSSFHLPSEYDGASEYDLTREDKVRVDWIDNRVNLEIDKGGDIHAAATVRLTALDSTMRCVNFYLDPQLEVDSVFYPNGEVVQFHRQEESWSGFVVLPDDGQLTHELTFHYKGEFLRTFKSLDYYVKWGSGSTVDGKFFVPHSSTGWYPSPVDMDRMQFDVRYTYPGDLVLVSAGAPRYDSTAGDRKISRYATSQPDLIFSFTLGYFDSEKYQLNDTESVVTVYDVGTGEAERVGKDCANSIRLFSYLFGPSPFRELRVTAGPMAHGQAFQQFLHLPWYDEYVGEKNSAISIGRAHEVAHAWWGDQVGWKSYHDQWLSEGLAEYSALLYAPFVLKSSEDFIEKLDEWKERILGARKYSFGEGAVLGSIWLGYRASSTQTRGDYDLATYRKGAWVLHMLRMMMIDLTTMKEDNFRSMMHEFYQNNVGKDVTTADFIATVEKYFGMDMKWFFDQWIYGVEAPTLRCTKSIVPAENGKYQLRLSVKQTDVSKPFRVFLPFQLTYTDGSTARARLEVKQFENEYSYVLDKEPRNVNFNILQSVLCKIEE